ncbi:uncharacterized protein LOC106014029 [Aplysia californica]|uniref:Uncharacterized protein LOC101848146 n=1 Tax=Aplysia californica TaxID=6500 RepID=A0ABM1A9R8_APLCA|nr:uncharacterized protein LOC101848146 [Aplysia californica]XP_012946484.1 uncharacterized protein LOC106014029 [Aplysia californica]
MAHYGRAQTTDLSARPTSLVFCLFVTLTLWTSSCMAARHVTLRPLPAKSPVPDERDVAIILVPELGVAHTDYKVFCRIIQQLYPLRLWVGLADISMEAAITMDNLPILLAETQQELHNAGMRTDVDVFLAAHGQTGHKVADYARAVPESLRGLILLGSFLPRRESAVSFPLPVLTLVGEVDGVTRITRIAQTIQEMIRAANFDPDIVVQSPLVILEGSNHEVYTVSQLPYALHLLDIEAEVDKSVGMETAANITAMFVANAVREPEALVVMAESEFKRAFDKAKNLTAPVRSLKELTQDELKSYWVKSAQKWLSGLEGKQSTQLEVDSYVVEDSSSSMALPPALVKEYGINYVVTFSDVIRYPHSEDGEDDGAAPQAPDEIAARMLGPERIQEYLKNTNISKNYTCRDLNYASYMTAYHAATERARQRYDNYHRGIVFLPDVVTDSSVLWETMRLRVETRDSELQVTSISYKTDNDMSQSQYSGLFFCKLLPPDKALEWIYVDSLRRNMASTEGR